MAQADTVEFFPFGEANVRKGGAAPAKSTIIETHWAVVIICGALIYGVESGIDKLETDLIFEKFGKRMSPKSKIMALWVWGFISLKSSASFLVVQYRSTAS